MRATCCASQESADGADPPLVPLLVDPIVAPVNEFFESTFGFSKKTWERVRLAEADRPKTRPENPASL